MADYDDTAFYYFLSSVLVTVAVPWTFNMVYNLLFPGKAEIEKEFPAKSKEGSRYHYCKSSVMMQKVDEARKRARKMNSSGVMFGVKVVILAGMWLTLYATTVHLAGTKEIKKFDPFEILEVPSGASAPDIKKAYRKLSLVYHPDKNPDDPLAANRFIQITKAYNALTDETAKANYEKYGNPDGPTTTKVGIGLPSFLLKKDNHLGILCLFFFLLLFVVPMVFICYYQRTKNYAANGVMIETLQFMGYWIKENTRLKNAPELLAASAESRSMETRSTDNDEMKKFTHEVVEPVKRQFNKYPIVIKNNFLLLGHMQRLHHLMSPALREDLDELLRHSLKISQAMIEIGCMREWFFTAQNMIEFRRCLIQGLDIKSSQLLQIPHFNEEILKHCSKGKNATSSLLDYIQKDAGDRKGLAGMEPAQLADVEAFASHLSVPEFKAITEVEDESEIVVGDIATVTCQLTRKNLQEGEAMGPVHAPLFPEPKFEEWWIFLVEGAPQTRIIAYERIRDTERVVEAKLRFQISRPGKHSLTVHALCDSYVGLDQKVDLNFTAKTEDEVKREIFVHPEDEELDLQPTLFQQFMGELGGDDESEEEEDDDKGKKDKVELRKKDSDDDGKKTTEGGDDDDSSSSSDSDGD
eukprot:TRINITY_DN49874_c0_g1_i1.p1 TRINITY_DN49874_c0_g1~~TRINITY_DN49874_c0_g1_i1.p1  ORF type:complete len:674 (+),score=192.36 TRINITY_DN49874_c0_g1_i1:111-2024(+)